MALDHVRDFFGPPGLSPDQPGPYHRAAVPDPLDYPSVRRPSPAHRDRPFLSLGRKPVPELSRFPYTGPLADPLELTLIRASACSSNVGYQVRWLIVISGAGLAIVVSRAGWRGRCRRSVTFGVALIAGHNLLDGTGRTTRSGPFFTCRASWVNRPGFVVFVAYPLDSLDRGHRGGPTRCQVYRLSRNGAGRSPALRPGADRRVGFFGGSTSMAIRPRACPGSGALTIVSFSQLTKPAIAALSADDARPGAADPARAGWSDAAFSARR